MRKNVIFERAKFNCRNQLPGESAEKYITALWYGGLEWCDYGELKEMLRDRIVVGMRDVRLSERLQMDPKLTLDKVKREFRQKEMVQQHQQELQGEVTNGCPTEMLEPVDQKRPPRKGKNRGGSRTSLNQNKGGPLDNCKRCGKAHHPPGARCPAATATCHKCNR